VSNICVHAIPDATQPIAIIFPHEVNLRAALPDEDPRTSLADLCADPKVKALVLKECNASGKRSGFKSIEMLQDVVLTADEWTPESGLVTAAQKLQRKKIAQRYDAEILVRFFVLSPCRVVVWYSNARARWLYLDWLTNQIVCRRLLGNGNELCWQ
jgi:long-subunit acyl-CoA synthetase (AMP-forming)